MHACNYEPVPQSDSVGVMDPRTNTSKPAGGIFSAARDDSRRGGTSSSSGAEGVGELRWRCRLGSLTMIRSWNKTRA